MADEPTNSELATSIQDVLKRLDELETRMRLGFKEMRDGFAEAKIDRERLRSEVRALDSDMHEGFAEHHAAAE